MNATFGRIILLAGGVFFAVLVIGILVDRSGVELEAHQLRDPNNPLVCVEFGSDAARQAGISEAELVQLVDAAWDDAAERSSYYPAATVEYPCPTDAVLQCPGDVTPYFAIECREMTRAVSYPDRYLDHIFVIAQDEFDIITGNRIGAYLGRTVGIEFSCAGDVCEAVTSAIYVTVDEVRSTDGLRTAFGEVLGLVEIPEPTTVGEPAIDSLKWSTRAHLAACVEFAGALAHQTSTREADARQRLLDSLAEIAEDSRWDFTPTARSAADSRVADYGCPREAVQDCYGTMPIECPWENFIVSQPSDYLVFVFVVSPGDLERITDGGDTRVAVIEQIRTLGGNYREVTFSVYITPEQLEDQESLVAAVSEAIGF